jgi:hypothetical protein
MVSHSLAESIREERVHEQSLGRARRLSMVWIMATRASGQIVMRKLDGWESPAEKPSDRAIDLAV